MDISYHGLGLPGKSSSEGHAHASRYVVVCRRLQCPARALNKSDQKSWDIGFRSIVSASSAAEGRMCMTDAAAAAPKGLALIFCSRGMI